MACSPNETLSDLRNGFIFSQQLSCPRRPRSVCVTDRNVSPEPSPYTSFLDMSRLDLAAVIDDFAGWVDQGLRKIESCVVDLGKA